MCSIFVPLCCSWTRYFREDTGDEKRQSLFPFTCWQLNFANIVGFLCHKDKLQIRVHLVIYWDPPCPFVHCCFLSSCHPACITAWLMLFLVQDFTFTFERLLSGHFFNLLSLPLQGIASSSHFALAEGTHCLIFIKGIKQNLSHLFITVKQHLHVFSLHYLQTIILL